MERFSNNAWLQEMPKPQNKMTWDNAVWISPQSAVRYGVATGDVVEIAVGRPQGRWSGMDDCPAMPTNR